MCLTSFGIKFGDKGILIGISMFFLHTILLFFIIKF